MMSSAVHIFQLAYERNRQMEALANRTISAGRYSTYRCADGDVDRSERS